MRAGVHLIQCPFILKDETMSATLQSLFPNSHEVELDLHLFHTRHNHNRPTIYPLFS